jgi:hypothetical protein
MEVKFERQALYAEVWTTPLTKLGLKYGMSDNGLRKVCKAMNIPLPRVGHWARIAANQEVLPAPLPVNSERSMFISQVPDRTEEVPAEMADQIWLKERSEFEEQEANFIVVDPAPTRWHPKLIELKNKSLEAARIYQSRMVEKEKALAEMAKFKVRGPNLVALKYADVNEGGMLFNRQGSVIFRVSLVTLKRALAIANALFYAAQSRGCMVDVGAQGDRLRIQLELASFSISIRERQGHKLAERNGYTEKQYRAADKLAVAVDKHPGSQFEIVDTAAVRVEQRLNDLFTRLYTTVVAARVADRVQKIKSEQKAIADRAYEEITRRHAVEAKLKAEEDGRRKVLVEEFSAWQAAQNIRAYSAHVRNACGGMATTDVTNWHEWANAVADLMDPTMQRIAALHSIPE